MRSIFSFPYGRPELGADVSFSPLLCSLKIRFIPLPRFPTLRLPFFLTTTSPSSPAKTSQQVLDDLVRSAKEHFAERDQRGVTVYRYEYDDEMVHSF